MLPLNTLTTVLDGVSYYVHPQILRLVESLKHLGNVLKPVVVLSSEHGNITNDDILEKLRFFAAVDDVYDSRFSDAILLQNVRGHSESPLMFTDKDENRDYPTISSFTVDSDQHLLPEGPYFLFNGAIHQAWRLYPDTLGAFVEPVIPDDTLSPKRYSALQVMVHGGMYKSIAVPSRMYTPKTKNKPLAGLRVSLKDSIRLAGIKTTMMNRAYAELYPPDTKSAFIASKLTDLGAVILGKTKMCAFASAEEPTDQWVDYHCPWNPRGDFYQSPSGSTTGGGASLAGYGWLDFSIGTDTSGSIRSPAAYNGLFSLRSTWNSGPMEGIVESCRLYDTIGILSRSIQGCHYIAKSLLDVNEINEMPRKILYPLDFFPQADEQQQKMTDLFVRELEDFIGVRRTDISIAQRWDECPPVEANGKSMAEYLDKSSAWPMYWYTYHAFDDFRSEYRAKFKKNVYIGPYMQFRWGIGEAVTEMQRNKAMGELEVFRRWFSENIMALDQDSMAEAILIMPFGNATPQYRDVAHAAPVIISTVNPWYLSPVLQVPQLMIPIGQKKYQSRVSGREEYLPIVSSLIGSKGSDLMLSNLATSVLKGAKWPTSVNTGRFMFDLGKNERNTAEVNHTSVVNGQFDQRSILKSAEVNMLSKLQL